MSDERIRELERRWQESGSVEDEAAWLRERVRVGDLDRGRLALVAFLGDAAAVFALRNRHGRCRRCGSSSRRRHEAWCPPRKIEEWWKALSSEHGVASGQGLAVRSRACLALVLSNNDLLDSEADLDELLPPEGDAYCVLPATVSWLQTALVSPLGLSQERLAETLERVAYLPDYVERDIGERATAAQYLVRQSESCMRRLLDLTRPCLSDSEIRQVVKEELVPWALGYRDPVRERVEARQREATGD